MTLCVQKQKLMMEKVVRFHQPQEDVDTIRRMIKKYNRAGGELYEDNCFYVQRPITKVDDEGREYQAMMKIMLDLTWVEILREHTIVMR